MSNYDKSAILSILNNFAKICDKRSKEIYSIEHDENLSDSGKSYEKERLFSDYEKELSNNKSKIEVIIDSAINQIKKEDPIIQLESLLTQDIRSAYKMYLQ